MVLKYVYLLTCVFSLAELIVFYEKTSLNSNKNFLLLYITTLISNFGYTILVFSETLQVALLGNFISYFGSILTIYFLLIVISWMCQKKIPFYVRVFLFIYALFISIMIATAQLNSLFYKEIDIIKFHGITMLKSVKGIGIRIYVVYLAIINISAICVIIYTIIQRHKVSRKILYSLLGIIIFGTSAYLVPLSFGSSLNLMPFIYVFFQTYFLYFSIKASTYDLAGNLINVYKQRGGYGYITFDNKKHLLGYDSFAESLFPNLKKVSIDSYIPQKYTKIIEKLHYNDKNWDWVEHCNKDFQITSNNKFAICTIHLMTSGKKNIGFLFELRDDTAQQNYIKSINSFNKELTKMVTEKTLQVTSMEDSIIRGMAMMVESRDNSTGGHILRTSDSIKIFAEELLKHKNEVPGLSQEFCAHLVKAAPMHDLGKIAVDDSILRKPAKFSPEEYEIMKTHAAKGAVIVQELLKDTADNDFKSIAVNVAHYHHEKWNGEGYPEHLKGTDIPLEARIMALADVFDALVSKRCYKEAFSFDQAFTIIHQDLGKHFDPIIGQIFLQCREQIEKYYADAQ